MILNIINPHASYYLGGTEVVTLYQALGLAKRGHTIRYFTRQTRNYSDYFVEFRKQAANYNVTIVEVPLDSGTPYANGSWPLYYYLSREFGMAAQPYYERYRDADLYVAHLSADLVFVPYHAKCLLHLHGSPTQTDALMDMAMEQHPYTVAHSRSIKEWWEDHYPSLTPEIFRNGIDSEKYSGEVTSQRPIDILYTGRFLSHKGIDDILASAPQTAKIVIAGNGPYLPELQLLAKNRKLENVRFLDRPSTATLRELYATSKLFICPSRAKEGVLTTMLEAGSSGCAIITASGSGMTDLITDRQNGRVVTPGDRATLGHITAELLEDSKQRCDLAEAVQENIRQTWSWDMKAVELEGIYAHAIKA